MHSKSTIGEHSMFDGNKNKWIGTYGDAVKALKLLPNSNTR